MVKLKSPQSHSAAGNDFLSMHDRCSYHGLPIFNLQFSLIPTEEEEEEIEKKEQDHDHVQAQRCIEGEPEDWLRISLIVEVEVPSLLAAKLTFTQI